MSKVTYIQCYIGQDFNVRKTEVTEHNILGSNDKYCVLDDYYFTRLQFHKDKSYNLSSVLDEVQVTDYTKDKFWRDYYGAFCIKMYSSTGITKQVVKKVEKGLNKFLNDKISSYGGGVEVKLSVEDFCGVSN